MYILLQKWYILYGEKLSWKFCRWRKITNMRYVVTLFGPTTKVTLFGAATSGGKKADRRLLFGTERPCRMLKWDLKPIAQQYVRPGMNFLASVACGTSDIAAYS